MSERIEYIAAGLLNAVGRENAWVPDQLVELFFEKYELIVQTDEISAAADILVDCGIAYSEEDPFAGRFIKICRSRCAAFLAAVEEERDPSFKGRSDIVEAGSASAIVKTFGFTQHRPNLAKYNKYPVLKRYHEFGKIYIENALSAIATRGHQHGVMGHTSTEPLITYHPPPIESSTWTGLPSGFQLSQQLQQKLVADLDRAEEALGLAILSQEERSQARAYIIAIRVLAEAPDPQADLIWEMIGRVNQISGIASLFVSIIALFATVAH